MDSPFIAEPVLGAGGVVVPPEGYYPAIQAVLDEHDVLLIDDEVICGFGRLGTPFGAEAMEMRPDTASVAKALSSAYLPISAVLVPDEMVDVFVEAGERWGLFGHGFTYTGHPVCAAVALKALELMEERDLFAHAARVGHYFQAGLRRFADHPLVGRQGARDCSAPASSWRTSGAARPFRSSAAWVRTACNAAWTTV